MYISGGKKIFFSYTGSHLLKQTFREWFDNSNYFKYWSLYWVRNHHKCFCLISVLLWQYYLYIETSQLICILSQLTGFYMRGTLL